jgi:antitoxin component of MazEF toxin-antitoxin module
MIKKLSKYGNSFAIIIDKPILKLLNITHDTKLKIKTDGEKIIIEPTKNTMLEKLYKKNVRKYAADLKKLAKS